MRLYDLDDKYSLIQYINEDCVKSYRMKVHMERIDEQFFKPWARYLEEATLDPQQIQQIFKSAHDESQASGQNSTMLGKVVEKIIPDSLLQKLSDSIPAPDANAVNDPQFTATATAAVNKLPVDEQTKGGLMKIIAQGAKDPAIQGVILALVGGVLGGMISKAGPALNAFGLGGTALAAVSGALVAGGVAVAAAKIQGKGWKEAFKGAIKPALTGAAGAVVGKLATDFISGLGASAKTINDIDPEATHQAGGGLELPDADKASNDAATAKAASDWAAASPAERAQIEKVTGMSPEQLQSKISTTASDPSAAVGGGMKMPDGSPMTNAQLKAAMDQVAPVAGGNADPNKYYNSLSPEQQRAVDNAVVAQANANTQAAPSSPAPYGANMDPAYLQRVVDAQGTSGVRFKISPEDAAAALNYQSQQTKGKLTQSKVNRGNKLSEGQVYLVMKRTVAMNTRLLSEGYMVAEAGVLQKAGSWLKTKAQNVTQNVTADKLMQAWKAKGSPTDSNQVADIMTTAGVNADIVGKIYSDMQLPAPGTAGTADKVEPTMDPNAPAATTDASGKVDPTMDPAAEPQGKDAGTTGDAAAQPGAEAPLDFEAVKAMVLKLPTDRKVRMVKYMQNQLKVA